MEKRLYTAAVFASFAWNNRIPVEFSWNWKETAVCRNRPIFLLRSLRYPRYKTERFSIRPIYLNATLDTFPTIKISSCPTSIEISHQSVLRARGFLESSLLFLSFRSEFTRNVKKLRSVESKLGTSSILKSETKSSRLPTYLENVHLPSRLSPSAFDESRLDSRLGQRFLPGPRIARRYSRVEKPSRRVGPLPVLVRYSPNGTRSYVILG